MAQYGGDNYRPFCTEALPLLVRVIQSADSKTKENVNATENCISAVGKIMKFKPDCVNVEEVLPHWLSWLPLHEDKEEAVQTFSYLCDLIERYRPAFFLSCLTCGQRAYVLTLACSMLLCVFFGQRCNLKLFSVLSK